MSTRIYLSVGRGYTASHEQFIADFERHLRLAGLTPQTVGRNYYKNKEPLKAIEECMRECSGAVILAFERVRIKNGIDMPGSAEQKTLSNTCLPTVWNQIEAAMAYSLGRPLLVVAQAGLRSEGLLQHGYDWYVVSASLNSSFFSDPAFTGVLTDWKESLGGSREEPKTLMSSSGEDDLGKIGVGDLVSRMKPAQVWATVVAVAGMVAAAATLGYHAGSLNAPSTPSRANVEQPVVANTEVPSILGSRL